MISYISRVVGKFHDQVFSLLPEMQQELRNVTETHDRDFTEWLVQILGRFIMYLLSSPIAGS